MARYPLSHSTPYLATLQPPSYAIPFIDTRHPSKLRGYATPFLATHTRLSYVTPHLVTPFLKLVYTTEELTVFLVGVAQWGCGPRYEPAVLTLQQAGA
jgi:hypothetical protein